MSLQGGVAIKLFRVYLTASDKIIIFVFFVPGEEKESAAKKLITLCGPFRSPLHWYLSCGGRLRVTGSWFVASLVFRVRQSNKKSFFSLTAFTENIDIRDITCVKFQVSGADVTSGESVELYIWLPSFHCCKKLCGGKSRKELRSPNFTFSKQNFFWKAQKHRKKQLNSLASVWQHIWNIVVVNRNNQN